jgi:hypothetical protein
MIATVLLLLAVLEGTPAYGPPALPASEAVLVSMAPDTPAGPAIVASEVITYYAFLPLIARQPSGCAPIPGVQYSTLDVDGPPTDRPAEQHADLNLALRGYEATDAHRGLVDYGGSDDPKAPQLDTLFAEPRVPTFASVYQVYDWDWDCNCRGSLLTLWPVTLAGMAVAPGEVLSLPDSGYSISSGYEALVLYASEERITLKYTREDNVVHGYTLHVENVCVEPSLLALYREMNEAGRGRLPALRTRQPFGRALGTEIGVAIRDAGSFMDPRSRRDWWQPK